MFFRSVLAYTGVTVMSMTKYVLHLLEGFEQLFLYHVGFFSQQFLLYADLYN